MFKQKKYMFYHIIFVLFHLARNFKFFDFSCSLDKNKEK